MNVVDGVIAVASLANLALLRRDCAFAWWVEGGGGGQQLGCSSGLESAAWPHCGCQLSGAWPTIQESIPSFRGWGVMGVGGGVGGQELGY